jgi:uracil-DNA glycosylase
MSSREAAMRVSQCVKCSAFPCPDVKHECYIVPSISVRPENISILMVSEAAPDRAEDYYYARGDPLFRQTTVQAFKDAGANVCSVKDIVNLGAYLTTAVKCCKTGHGAQTDTIRTCSLLLERELLLFPKARAVMLMGDVAIKALNFIALRAGEKRVIPTGSAYRIRGREYFWRGMRAFPSYLQAGPSFFIEKSKRRMIADDIAAALRLITRELRRPLALQGALCPALTADRRRAESELPC